MTDNNYDYIPSVLCSEKMRSHEKEFDRNKEQLDKHDDNLAKLTEISIQLKEMIDAHKKDLEKHDARIAKIENRPSALWDKMIGAAIGAMSGGLVSALIALVLK